MKKNIFPFIAVATMLAAVSCSQDEMVNNEASGNEVEAVFNVNLEGAAPTRFISDGLTVNELIFEVYDKDGNRVDALRQEGIAVANKTATVKVRLVKGQEYQYVFWAQHSDQTYYDVTDLKNIEVTYTTATNDEKRDAFYCYLPLEKVTGSFIKDGVTLRRPFAQLNLGTTVADIAAAQTAGVVITHSKIWVKGGVYQSLSTFDGKVENPATYVETDFTVGAIPNSDENLVITDKDNEFEIDSYKYLATSYLLASQEGGRSTQLTFELYAGNEFVNTLEIMNAPLQRNYRTNIVGEALTGEGTFNIIIDPVPVDDHNHEMEGSNLVIP